LLEREIVDCRRCPRLVEWREQVATVKRAAYANETTTPTTLRGIFALDQRPPGTYVYVMTVIAESSLSPNFSVWDRYLSSVEIKR